VAVLVLPGDTLVATALELLAAGVVPCAAGLLTGEAGDLAPARVSGAALVVGSVAAVLGHESPAEPAPRPFRDASGRER